MLEQELTDFVWRGDWGQGNIYINPLTTRSGGQAILLKETRDIIEHQIIMEGRIQILKIKFIGTTITLINVYGPNKESDRRLFLDTLQNKLTTYDFGDYLIIGGDFNLVQNNNIDKYTKNAKHSKKDEQTPSQAKLEFLKTSFNLTDIWRQQNPSTNRYTWSQPNPLVRCRLDYFLISNTLMKSKVYANILPSIKSDHSLIEISLKLMGPPRGPGTWKLNTSLLQDEEYKKEIKSIINKTWEDFGENPDFALRFDWVKHKIREFSIKFSKEKSRIIKSKETNILKQIAELDKQICNESITDSERIKYVELKKFLEDMEEYRARGAWIRSRLEHLEEDEKSSAFFFNKSKHLYEKKTINCIKTDNQTEIIDPKEILKELESFYTSLYKSALNADDKSHRLVDGTDIDLRLTEEQMNSCEGFLTEQECFNALKTFKLNKSPGCDGIPAEFYLEMWPEIGVKLVKCLNFCLKNGSLSVSQRRGVITLLEKKRQRPVKDKELETCCPTEYGL